MARHAVRRHRPVVTKRAVARCTRGHAAVTGIFRCGIPIDDGPSSTAMKRRQRRFESVAMHSIATTREDAGWPFALCTIVKQKRAFHAPPRIRIVHSKALRPLLRRWIGTNPASSGLASILLLKSTAPSVILRGPLHTAFLPSPLGGTRRSAGTAECSDGCPGPSRQRIRGSTI